MFFGDKFNENGTLKLNYVVERVNDNIYHSRCRLKNKFEFNYDYFITFTFNPQFVNSNDADLVTKELKVFFDCLRHKTRTYADFKFRIVLCPDFASAEQGIHFHGLLWSNNYDVLKFVDSGRVTQNLEKIYNVELWDKGFTTAIKYDNNEKAKSYICKYINKYSGKLLKRRFYFRTNIKEERSV